MTMRPAHSARFDAEHLQQIAPVRLGGGIDAGWAFDGASGAGVDVCVIDSGVESGHPDVGEVQGGVLVEMPRGATEPRLVEGPHPDVFGHGTACAGIIRRVAPDCNLFSARVLGARLSGRADGFAAGLRWAIDHDMDVVNLSLGTDRLEHAGRFHELADEAFFKGVVLVCAANNMPRRTFPADYATVISVAAHQGRDPFRFDYNPVPPVEFGAPGIEVEVAWTQGRRQRVTGNSFAAPHLAGLVARMMSKHPGLTPFQVKSALLELADNARHSVDLR